MTQLKEFVDFALTLTDMEEVRNGKFPLPKEMVFELGQVNHRLIQRDLHGQYGGTDRDFEPSNEFDMEVFGINFKFIKK